MCKNSRSASAGKLAHVLGEGVTPTGCSYGAVAPKGLCAPGTAPRDSAKCQPPVKTPSTTCLQGRRRTLPGSLQTSAYGSRPAAGLPSPILLSVVSWQTTRTRSSPNFPWHLADSAQRVGLSYLRTFAELLDKVQAIHTHPPLALLRGGVECTALALWLIRPDGAQTRQERGLIAWHSDLKDRAGFERVTGWTAPGGGKAATARQAELTHIAHGLGLSVKKKDLSCTTTEIIAAAASEIDYPKSEALRLWSLSSGLAHGRYWPSIIGGLVPRGARISSPSGGYAVGLDISDEILIDMSKLAHRLTSAWNHWRPARGAPPTGG